MSPAAEEALEVILALPEAERLELTEAVVAARAGALPFDASWLPEIRARSAEIDAGSVVPAPWPEGRDRVRRRLMGSGDG